MSIPFQQSTFSMTATCLPCCEPDCCTSSFTPGGDTSSLTISGSSPTFTLAASTSNSSSTLSLGFTVGACVNLLAGSVLTLSAINLDGTCAADGGTLDATFTALDPDGNPLTPATTSDYEDTYDIPSDGCYCVSLALNCVGLSAGPVAADFVIASDMAIGCDAISDPP